MKYLRWLLLPFALLYGLVVVVRNWLYDVHILKSQTFSLPVISIGNLDVGGSGKTPMTEYVVRLLKDRFKTATLSRGYGRQTTGLLLATPQSTAAQIGDEPAQLKHKFPDITVAVCEDRVKGITTLAANHDVIIMDDAYQHRAVTPGLSLLLFDYKRFKDFNFLLPAGNRREPFAARRRAHIIIITKCPATITTAEKLWLTERMHLQARQQLFFTEISYLPLRTLHGGLAGLTPDKDTTVFLLTGIANAQPLLNHIGQYTGNINHHKYPDHHRFTLKNITKLAAAFNSHPAQKKLIITTEKDAQRLGERTLHEKLALLPFFVIPIGVKFLDNGADKFDQLINNYVR